MNWSNVKLVFLREVRDQLRDRRTLFTIAVLPLLLYPLLGMSFLQVAQFMHEHPLPIWIVGTDFLPEQPSLLEDGHFSSQFCSEQEARLLQLQIDAAIPDGIDDIDFAAHAKQEIQAGKYAVVVRFPPEFLVGLERLGGNLTDEALEASADQEHLPGMPEIIFDAASDKSRIGFERTRRVLTAWRQAIVQEFLAARHIPPRVTDPFKIESVDVSGEVRRRAALWSKILPFVALVWALTGAFYPAVDLCAGEKERGTLETLLSSPAERSEIVWGKLLTITLFSMATSVLNLFSMGFTATAVIHLQPGQFPMGAPPVAAMGWLLLALIPVSMLFSALALAVAAFARSTKEGQYYLMPLLMISFPLMILPMLPAVELTLGTSLVPITGMVLLLRGLVEGQYADVLVYAPPVILVTLGAALMAIRWAVDQFNNETVLFRESERWGFQLWLRHLVRDSGATPTFMQAIACGVLLLTVRFFATLAVKQPQTWTEYAILQLVTLVALVAAPALIMTMVLTRSPRATLLLRMPRWTLVGWALLLALAIHPAAMLLAEAVQRLYPISEEVLVQLQDVQVVILDAPSIWYILGLMALAPAICEELAFRGFMLSGLRHLGHKWTAIVISSVFFGLTHGILQQSITACLIGIVIGYIAVQTGSLLPGIAFHLVYNSLSLLIGFVVAPQISEQDWMNWFFEANGPDVAYRWPWVVVGLIVSCGVLWWFHRLPYEPTQEEQLQSALDHQSAHTAVSQTG
jgi:sodium transport system permease protein